VADLSPERYELFAGPAYRFEVGRRDVFKLLGGGLLVAFVVPAALGQESGARRGGGEALPGEVSAWLHVGEDGRVTVYTGKTEIGQNIRTSLAQAVAEELRVAVSAITMVMADTALTPFDMGTFGSRTTPVMGAQLRKVAQAAREALVDLAAQLWGVERGALVVAEGRVTHPPTRRAAAFGELTRGQKLARSVGDDSAITPPTRWTVAGQPVAKVNGRDIVTGRHRYTSDLSRPGMIHGRVLRPPSFGATLKSADTSPPSATATSWAWPRPRARPRRAPSKPSLRNGRRWPSPRARPCSTPCARTRKRRAPTRGPPTRWVPSRKGWRRRR